MEVIKDLKCAFCGNEQVIETRHNDFECLKCKRVYEKTTTKEDAIKIKAEEARWDREFFGRFGLRRRR